MPYRAPVHPPPALMRMLLVLVLVVLVVLVATGTVGRWWDRATPDPLEAAAGPGEAPRVPLPGGPMPRVRTLPGGGGAAAMAEEGVYQNEALAREALAP